VEHAAEDLTCFQNTGPSTRAAGQAPPITIGTIGDSITAGVHSSGGNHTYPGQLQV
jgi:hypothetical protein